nr:ATP-binding protein [Plastoroseomonas arctica]
MAAAVAAAPTGVVLADPRQPDCPITFANPAFLAMTGYAAEEVLGRNCRFLQGPGTEPGKALEIRRALSERRAIELTITNHRKDGKRFVNELLISPLFDADGSLRCFLGIQHDVTLREKARRAADRARRDALRAHAEKTGFLAFMSHEVRVPLNGVMGTLALLLETGLSAEQRAYAETARRCGLTLLDTMNDVLDLSRMEAGKFVIAAKPFRLAGPVAEVMELLRPAADEKGLALTSFVDPKLPEGAVGDAQRLRQVLLNLADNAVKFTVLGGVHISLHLTPEGRMRGVVKDSGVGIAPKVQARLFRRFSQGAQDITRRYGGTGLGLSICKRLVEMMGGAIWVESEAGHGATFTFDLPLQPIQRGALPRLPAPPASQPHPLPRRRTASMAGRILLAEDGISNQLVAAAILRKAGYEVDLVHDGDEAVAAARGGEYDLILMDIRMPGRDGIAATTAIRALPGIAGRVPIVALTASALPEDRERCLSAGMDRHIAKPMDQHQLLAVVAELTALRLPRPDASEPEPPTRPILLDRQTLEELRAAVGPGQLPRLLRVFAEETRERLARLLSLRDLGMIEDEAHGLKSAAGTFGAIALRDAALQIELAARAGDRATVARLLDALTALTENSLAAYPRPPPRPDAA